MGRRGAPRGGMTSETPDLGLDATRLARVTKAIEAEVEAERYDGAVVLVARRGQVALHEAVGFAERSSARPARTDDVFHLMSVTKAYTAGLVLQRVDRGEIQLTTLVAEIIPEFAVLGKQRITVAQLLSHTAGLPPDLPFLMPDQLGDVEAVALAVCGQALLARPGGVVSYSPLGAFAILGEIVRRLDGGQRRFRRIMEEDLFAPLGMKSSSLGLRPDLAERRAPVVVRDRRPAIFPAEALEAANTLMTETFEMPGGGALGTAQDVYRYAEMLRRGGELDGERILSPALLELATRNHTGLEPNHIFDSMCEARGWDPFPAHIGLGFFLRGEGIFTMPFGLSASPGTFGGLGAGSTVFWVDPRRELVFVCLTTGLLEDSRHFERMQRLSDLVLAAVVD